MAPIVARVTSVSRINKERRVRNIRNRSVRRIGGGGRGRFPFGEDNPDKGDKKSEDGFKVLHF